MGITPISSFTLPLTPVTGLQTGVPAGTQAGIGPTAEQDKSFGNLITDAVNQLNQTQQQADVAAAQVAAGRGGNLHDALVTMEEASLSLQLALQVRNKLVDSYQEIMRMQV